MSETVTYTITKIGSRWLEGVAPDGSLARIQKNSLSRTFIIGESYTFSARLEEKATGRSRKTVVFPDSSDDYIVIVRGEPSGAFGPIRRQFISGQSLRNPLAEEQILTVVKESSRFFSEGGMSYGIGDHEGWLHTAYCRPASQLEIQEFLGWEKENQSSHEHKLDLIEAWQSLRDIVRDNNDLAHEADSRPVAVTIERLLRDTGFKDGGELFGIDSEGSLWHVRSKNLPKGTICNVQIGGQPGLGCRCPLKTVLDKLTAHQANILQLDQ